MKIRLDKYLSDNSELTRATAKRAMHRGDITVNGEIVKNPAVKVSASDEIQWLGTIISELGIRYIMLHKPADYVSSTQDDGYPSVLNLIDAPQKHKLHIAGRLDADTTGLLLISDDGQWSHRVTSPNKKVGKRYLVTLADPCSEEMAKQLRQGVMLHGEDKPTLPAEVEMLAQNSIRLTIKEGKYHQVKRMLAAVGTKVVGLHREQIGLLELDAQLEEGKWRYLTEQEVAYFAK